MCACDSGEAKKSGGKNAGTSGSFDNPDDGDFGNTTAGTPGTDEPLPTAGKCKPGHYTGSFVGIYRPPATFTFPIMIGATGSMGKPGLEFWLKESSAPCIDEEFCGDFEITGGKIQGFAQPGGTGMEPPDAGAMPADPFAAFIPAAGAVPFSADLNGALDCESGKFVGSLDNGKYTLFVIDFLFDGLMVADYAYDTSSLEHGIWQVAERTDPASPAMVTPGTPAAVGGEGDWKAKWVDDAPAP